MIKNFAPGEIIVREGDASTCAFFIDGGEVEVIKETHGGEPCRLAVLSKGEIFGEMGLIDELPRSATVRAMDEGCQVTILTPDNYQVLLEDHNQALMQIINVYGDRLRKTLKLVAELQRNQKSVKAA